MNTNTDTKITTDQEPDEVNTEHHLRTEDLKEMSIDEIFDIISRSAQVLKEDKGADAVMFLFIQDHPDEEAPTKLGMTSLGSAEAYENMFNALGCREKNLRLSVACYAGLRKGITNYIPESLLSFADRMTGFMSHIARGMSNPFKDEEE